MTQELQAERPVLTTVEDLEALNHGAVLSLTIKDEADYAAIATWETSGRQEWLVTGEERYFTAPELLSYYGDTEISLLFSPETDRVRG